jgi:hypothetical protein
MVCLVMVQFLMNKSGRKQSPLKPDALKTRLFYTIFILISFVIHSAPILAQIPNEAIKAFEKGNSQQLARLFSSNIELNINQKEEVYSKAQAELILKDFFVKNEPDSFRIENEGFSDGIIYTIALLTTNSGRFRIYITYRKLSGKQFINRLTISQYN